MTGKNTVNIVYRVQKKNNVQQSNETIFLLYRIGKAAAPIAVASLGNLSKSTFAVNAM